MLHEAPQARPSTCFQSPGAIFSGSAATWLCGFCEDLYHPSITGPGLVNIQKAIENGPVEIVDLPYLPIKNGGSFHSKLRYFLLFSDTRISGAFHGWLRTPTLPKKNPHGVASFPIKVYQNCYRLIVPVWYIYILLYILYIHPYSVLNWTNTINDVDYVEVSDMEPWYTMVYQGIRALIDPLDQDQDACLGYLITFIWHFRTSSLKI